MQSWRLGWGDFPAIVLSTPTLALLGIVCPTLPHLVMLATAGTSRSIGTQKVAHGFLNLGETLNLKDTRTRTCVPPRYYG